MKNFLLVFALLSVILSTDCMAAEVIFSEKFNKITSLEEIGFRKIRDNKRDVFKIDKGELRMACFHSPHKGTAYAKKIAVPEYGELNFELRISPAGVYNNFSLQMKLGNLLFSFRDPYWRIYRRKTNTWLYAGKISVNQYHKFRIRFNSVKKYAEFYVDDMKNPVLVDSESDIKADAAAELLIANYGHASGQINHALQNIELKKLDKSFFSSGADKPLKGTWIFYGIGFEDWRIAEIRKKCPEPIDDFFVQNIGSHPETTLNKYDLQPCPPVNIINLPAKIIFADMPLRPIPEYARRNIVEAVKKGASFLLLNGYFTLNKGDFLNTEIASMLPLDVSDRWNNVKVIGGISKKYNSVFAEYGKGTVGVFLNKKLSSQAEFDMLLDYIRNGRYDIL